MKALVDTTLNCASARSVLVIVHIYIHGIIIIRSHHVRGLYPKIVNIFLYVTGT
jgi:hypothetical protein